MNWMPIRSALRLATVASLMGGLTVLTVALAQTAGAPGVPAGKGAGVHSPDSPIAPLPQRSDVVPWSVLTAVKTKTEKNRVLPAFEPQQLVLNDKKQRVQGFMMPLEPGEK